MNFKEIKNFTDRFLESYKQKFNKNSKIDNADTNKILQDFFADGSWIKKSSSSSSSIFIDLKIRDKIFCLKPTDNKEDIPR